jgi:hypothetical protein
MFLFSLLAGCESNGGRCVSLAPGANYCLAEGDGPHFDTEQASTISYAGNTMRMITRIHSDEDGLHFAGVTPLGQTLLHVYAGKQGIKAQLPPGMEDKVDGAMFAALVQLAMWPVSDVCEGLRGGLTLLEDPGRRSILQGEKILLTVSWEGTDPPYDIVRFDIPAARVTVESRTLNTSAP